MATPLDPRPAVGGDRSPLAGASVLPAHDVPEHLLLDFYNTVFPGRRIPEVWRWWYRCSFHANQVPLVVLHEQRVVAHAGIIPFHLSVAGKTWNAAWFIDFAVLPDYQHRGLGIWLTRKWMGLSDVYVTFCNDKSMGVFRTYGWRESFDTYLLYLFLKPFDHPRLAGSLPPRIRHALNVAMGAAMRLNYERFARPLTDLNLHEPDERDEAVIFRPRSDSLDAEAVRDTDWFRWRVLSSPDRRHYRVFTLDGVTLLCKLTYGRSLKTVDVLWVSDLTHRHKVRRTIATVAVWARREGCAYVRFYTSDPELSRFVSRSLLALARHPRYAFFSENPDLLSVLDRARWDWQLIDSDFERF